MKIKVLFLVERSANDNKPHEWFVRTGDKPATLEYTWALREGIITWIRKGS